MFPPLLRKIRFSCENAYRPINRRWKKCTNCPSCSAMHMAVLYIATAPQTLSTQSKPVRSPKEKQHYQSNKGKQQALIPIPLRWTNVHSFHCGIQHLEACPLPSNMVLFQMRASNQTSQKLPRFIALSGNELVQQVKMDRNQSCHQLTLNFYCTVLASL